MIKKSFNNLFGEETEIEKIFSRLSDPNFQGGSVALPENASLLEQTKYNLCQSILTYKFRKKLSLKKLAQQIRLSVPEVENILHCRINKFTLDRLINYAETLAIPLKVVEEKRKSS